MYIYKQRACGPHTYTCTCMYIHTYMHACIHTYVHAYLRACMHACMHTYVPTYIHTYIHTYINTYIHTLSTELPNYTNPYNTTHDLNVLLTVHHSTVCSESRCVLIKVDLSDVHELHYRLEPV
jgi:hypothetical protein